MNRRHVIAGATATAGACLSGPSLLRAAPEPELHLGVVADPQYADVEPLKTRYYRRSLDKLSEAIVHFNTRPLDLCVNVGDTIDRDWGSYGPVLAVCDRSRRPFQHVLGNHDFDLGSRWKPEVPARLGLKQRYSVRTVRGWSLVFLDTNDVSTYAYPPDGPETAAAAVELERLKGAGAVQAQGWNGGVGTAQMRWLETVCRDASAAGRRVLIFAHHPIHPENIHNAWNFRELREFVTRNRAVAAWINGHNHAGNFGFSDDLPCVTLHGMVETESSNAYAVLQAYADRLVINGFGREPSRDIKIRPA